MLFGICYGSYDYSEVHDIKQSQPATFLSSIGHLRSSRWAHSLTCQYDMEASKTIKNLAVNGPDPKNLSLGI